MKILVVEDEPLIRLGVVSLIEEMGLATLEAGNADAAMAILDGPESSGVSVLVTDVDMPGSMDGIALAALARQRWPDVGVIAISGKVGVDETALPAGVRFFAKPLRDDVLMSAIRQLLPKSIAE